MAKEWYLMNSSTRPNSLGGFENQGFLDYKDDAFAETLETDIADTVLLCNFDLTAKRPIRAIIQGNTADTQLKSMERTILAPIGTLQAGNYIFFEDEYWLVNGRPGNNKIYEKATLIECQYLLRWQNARGKIIERWINLTSASKYDVGENGNNIIMLSSNNFTIQIPNDFESLNLDGKRVFIDQNKQKPSKVFKLTRNDDSLYFYNSHGGVLNFIASKTELNDEKDNKRLMICDYITPSLPPFDEETGGFIEDTKIDESPVLLTSEIKYRGKAELKTGGNYKMITGVFKDKDCKELDTIGNWSVITIDELTPYVQYTVADNILKIKISEDDFTIGGKVRVIFSHPTRDISSYVDFNIVSNI